MKFKKALMETAFIWSKLSYCKRRKVGAVISKDNRVLVTAYNGRLPDEDNCCEDEDNNTLNNVVHAERSALMYAAKNGIPMKDCTLYVTLSPCEICASLIIQSGIKEVCYSEEYRTTTGISLLLQHGIKVTELK